jgi:hypothetical protein
MKYTIYNADTGQILGTVAASSEDLLQTNADGSAWIEGDYSGSTHYIINGQAQLLPDSPDTLHVWHQFDYATATWQVDLARSEQISRQERNTRLTAVDRVNAVWYASLTTEQQAELAAYRQALLAVPQQARFPADVVWPAKPTWL